MLEVANSPWRGAITPIVEEDAAAHEKEGRPYDEGVAIHIGPESCAVAREGLGEALTGWA
jgi:hypothetical protein